MKFRQSKSRQNSHLLPMQRVVDELLSGHMLGVTALARLIASKLESQGAEMTEEKVEWLRVEIGKRLSGEDGLTWEHPFTGDIPNELGDYNISIEAEEVDKLIAITQDAMEEAVLNVMESFFQTTLHDVRRQADEALARQAGELAGFRERLAIRWSKPLRLLSLELGLSIQYGSDMTDWLRSKASDADDALVEALLRLHARACQISGEIEVLLRAGFADGALSRWRTLHEVSVVALFLQERGNDVAIRYLDHLSIDSLDMARKYKIASEKIGHTRIGEKELVELEEGVAALKDKYGKEFATDYGWAAAALKNVRPKFSDIEKAIDFQKFRPYYKLASTTIHAGPKGAFWKLGIISQESDMLLAGPSNAGLAEAGRLTAISLAQIAVALMMVHPSIDGTVWGRVILKLSGEVEAEFLKSERKLASDEGVLRVRRFSRDMGKNFQEKISARLRRRLGK